MNMLRASWNLDACPVEVGKRKNSVNKPINGAAVQLPVTKKQKPAIHEND